MAARKQPAKGRAVEVDGISVTVAIDQSDDWELAEASLTINDPDATQLEKSRALVRQCKLVLGSDYQRVMGELRARNGGRLPAAAVVSFCNRVLAAEGGDAKN